MLTYCHMIFKMAIFPSIFTLLAAFGIIFTEALPCSKLTDTPGHVVCVCNSTYCDDFPSTQRIPKGQYAVYTSSESGLRFQLQTLNAKTTSSNAIYKVDTAVRRQSIIGFGGAFTDAAGINIVGLPVDAQDKLIGAYYGKEGIGYSVGRVPMASCDFSTHQYSYDDVPGDLNLTKFALAPEDLKYKIPLIQSAMKKSPLQIKLFGSPWSAPAWMKTNNNMTGKGSLKGEPGGPYYKTWAQYFIRFLEEYSSHNISFWGLTVQNEPNDGMIAHFPFQSMGYSAEMERDFVKKDLGPALKLSAFKDINLMILDDNRLSVLDWANVILSDPEASKYVSGVGVHWYIDNYVPANLLEKTHHAFPSKFLLATEACEGSMPWQTHVILGSWDRAITYAHDIITDLNQWVTGWTDWNIALSPTGGPNWVNNFVDSPIIVDAKKASFYKQPMYYALGHFSKFFVPDSVWVSITAEKENDLIETTAFLRSDNSVAVVINNSGYESVNITIQAEGIGYLDVASPGRSIQTVVWWID